MAQGSRLNLLQKISLATICQSRTPLRPSSVAWDRFNAPCSARPQYGNDDRTLFLPCCWAHGGNLGIPASFARSRAPAAPLVSFGNFPVLLLSPRPLLVARCQSHSQTQNTRLSVIGLAKSCTRLCGIMGGRDKPMAFSSSAIPAFSSHRGLLRLRLCTPHLAVLSTG
jgi:hypothetical protein